MQPLLSLGWLQMGVSLLFAGSLNVDTTIGQQTVDQGFTGLRLALRLAIGLRNLEIGLAATLGADDTGGDA